MQSQTMEPVPLRAAIDAANRAFMDAFNAGDIAGAARGVYTRDARVLPPGGEMVRGRDDIIRFWQAAAAQMGIRRVVLSTVELEAHGDSAHEIGRALLSLDGGQEVAAKYVVVWKREEGAWRWDVDIWNTNA